MNKDKARRGREEDRPLSREEDRRRRKKKARRLMWKRLITVIVIALAAWGLWNNWDTLAPDKLLARVQDFISDASGTYPVDISGSNVQHIIRSQNYTVTLSDSYLTYYNDKGGEVTRYACTYSSATLRTAGKYVLVAEQGGKRLLLTTRSMQLADLTAGNNILAATVNAKGQVAVLTQSSQGYAVELTVYDQKGQTLYSRKRSTPASDVALSPDGKTAALLSLEAVDGVLNTTVEAFRLNSADTAAMYSHTVADTLLYRLNFLGNNRLVAVGEDGAVLMPLDDSDPSVFTVNGLEPLGYAVANNTVAVVTRPKGDTHGGTVTVLDKNAKELCRVAFDGEFRHVTAQGSQYLLLTDQIAQIIANNGGGRSASVEADGQQAVLYSNRAVVLGLSALQEYPLT